MSLDASKAPFESNLDWTIADLKVIASYRKGDRFAVQEGQLVLDKKRFWQGPMRTVKNIFLGGYNRYAVTNYMERLADRIETLNQEQLTENAHQLIRLPKIVCHLRRIYIPQPFSFQSKEPNDRMGQVYTRIKAIVKDLTFEHPLDSDFNQIDFDDPTFPEITKPPEGIQPKRIVELSNALSDQIGGKVKRVAIKIFKAMAFGSALVPLAIASILKVLVWNPLELLFRREIRTQAPLTWLVDQLYTDTAKEKKIKMETYASWLFQGKEMTDDELEAFEALDWIGEKFEFFMFWNVAIESLDELQSALEELGYSKSVKLIKDDSQLQEKLRQEIEGKRINLKTFLKYSPNDPKETQFLSDYKNYRQLQVIQEKDKHLSYTQLKKIIEITTKHRECREISLPLGLSKVQKICRFEGGRLYVQQE